ncbi:MAG: AraC family transcriptional regulator [Rhodoblastus sp.]|uniref:AraC family transcriptional regulator n=1 Tax=Rhodoblastus sp. TaxID=1962975 RepID=UPI003F9BB9C0
MEPDLLSDALSMVRLTGAVIFRIAVDGPWCVSAAPTLADFAPALPPGTNHLVAFHVFLSGECWVRCPPRPWARARAGDAVVLPHGQLHQLGDHCEESPPSFRDVLGKRSPLELRELRFRTGEAPRTEVLCGFLGCDRRAFSPLFSALPPIFVTTLGSGAQLMVRYAVEEALSDQPGAGSLRVRLAELMFLESLRGYMRDLPDDATGWLAGLRDPLVGKALKLMHEAARVEWTVEALAERAACSRSLLAERFKTVIGEAPMHYLTRVRLHQAAQRLSDGGRSLEAIADEVGYASPAAFQRAFKRCFGVAPGAWRREARERPH